MSNIISEIGFSGEAKFGEKLADHTSLRIGGPADCLLLPADRRELAELLRRLPASGARTYILGNGTNLLVADRGVEGAVIKTGPALDYFRIDGNNLTAGAGRSLSLLCRDAAREGLSGLEPLSGIPGTVGGAVAMNAGYGGKNISDLLSRVAVLTSEGEISNLAPANCSFSYRESRFLGSGEVVLEAEFRLRKGDRAEVERRLEGYLQERKERFPAGASAGSVFKNPPGEKAGRLIEAAGLKGHRIGKAGFSEDHANFIINLGGAEAGDVLELIDLARKRVRQESGIGLELELAVWE